MPTVLLHLDSIGYANWIGARARANLSDGNKNNYRQTLSLVPNTSIPS
jgi:hypothetical protein